MQTWKPGSPARVAGYGIELRTLTPGDIEEALVAQLRNPEVSRHLALFADPALLTRENLLRILKTFDNRRNFFFAITASGDPRLLGLCWARTNEAGVATLTLAVTDPAQWRRGLGIATTYLLRNFLFNAVKIHKAVARAYSDNAAVIARLERTGWVREGLLREAEPDGKGGRRDVVVYALLREEHERGPKPNPLLPASS